MKPGKRTTIGTPLLKNVRVDPGEANPPHGQKSDFVRTTITLPPAVYELIANEATRRKLSHLPNPVVSAIIREAVVAYLKEA